MQALWMLVCTLMFSIMGASVKFASEQQATLGTIILMRGLPSIVLLLGWALLRGKTLKPVAWQPHFWRNLSGISSMWAGFFAFTLLPLATATTLTYTAPLFVAGWMLGWGGARRDFVRLLAVIIGFTGVLVVMRPAINPDQWAASLLGLSSGALAAVAQLQVRSLGRLGEPVWRVVLYFSICGSTSGLVALLFHGWQAPTPLGWVALVSMGLSGMFGQMAMTRAFGAGSVLLSAALQYTIIIWATLLGFLIWNDKPDPMAAVGMVLIVAASLLSVWRTMRSPG